MTPGGLLSCLSSGALEPQHKLAVSQVRLSERNVVELVGKLQGAGLLGPDLLHTLNGREYLTQEQLRAEVQAAVESAGGRVPVVSRGIRLLWCLQCGEARPCQRSGAPIPRSALSAWKTLPDTMTGYKPARQLFTSRDAIIWPTALRLTWPLALQVDLPALLGVDLVHCERQAGAAVAEAGGQLQLVQGELITLAYFDALAADVADSLRVGRNLRR